jgi:hypothetical protein
MLSAIEIPNLGELNYANNSIAPNLGESAYARSDVMPDLG